MPKRKIEYKESYNKGISLEKTQFIEMLKKENTKVLAVNSGKYDDGKGFITITIEDL